jgi:hypothetical protein
MSMTITHPKLEQQTVIQNDFPFSAGPQKIIGTLCPDGSQQTAVCSPLGADTFFSIPASVQVKGTRVAGYVTRETLAGFTTETPGDPAVWKFRPYKYRKKWRLVSNEEE